MSSTYLYPKAWSKTSALLHSLVKNHPFNDGNKRTAYYSAKRFLYINGYTLSPKESAIIAFIKAVDVKNLNRETIEAWLKNHAKKR